MKRYLFTWECGAGLGHLARYQQLIEALLERGHEVLFASRNLDSAERVYGHLPVKLTQAPVHQRAQAESITPHSYVDVLINQGFEHSLGLKARTKAWLQLLESYRPSAIIADHSPTLLLAHRLYTHVPCIAAGSGFCVPPVAHPFPPFNQQTPRSPEDLIAREQELLNTVINPVLTDLGGPAMDQCQQLFSVHAHWLFGLADLDHYPGQRVQSYLGTSPSMGGDPASWPELSGPRVFLYLKPHRTVPQVLKIVRELQWPSLIYAPDWPDAWRRDVQSPSIRLSVKPLDLQSVGKSCHLAVNNGGMNSVTELLLLGVPQVLLPLHVEQSMFSRSAERTGACIVHSMNPDDSDRLRNALKAVANPDGPIRRAAAEFASRQARPTEVQVADLLNRLEAIG